MRKATLVQHGRIHASDKPYLCGSAARPSSTSPCWQRTGESTPGLQQDLWAHHELHVPPEDPCGRAAGEKAFPSGTQQLSPGDRPHCQVPAFFLFRLDLGILRDASEADATFLRTWRGYVTAGPALWVHNPCNHIG
ncbi:unnamed protein product [Nyctereutes procyonoides]|uniref:(raccoon dog) hypothetical protein n=1 Tax=Nyctereutes procyonoides TaxID=34880 RepID=A0A811ZUF4_NYCPR|nr:unnamed protein product [Nyctereutes procyonoides]